MPNSLTRTTLPAVRSVTMAFVLLAGITGLLWPHETIPRNPHDIISGQAEDTIEPIPVRTLSYHLSMQGDEKVVTFPEKVVTYPAWTVREDGLWVPWTMQPPAWLTTIASSYVVAETVPMPPERSARLLKTEQQVSSSKTFRERIASDGDICARHGLKKVYTDRFRWRCR